MEDEKAPSKNLIKSSEGAGLRLSRHGGLHAAHVHAWRQDLAVVGGHGRRVVPAGGRGAVPALRRSTAPWGLPAQAAGWAAGRHSRGVLDAAEPLLRLAGLPAAIDSTVGAIPGTAGVPGRG